MKSLNKVMLIGNLTRDPEIREVSNGMSVAEFGLAMNRSVPDGEEKREETTYVDVVLWNRQAELAQRFLCKGRKVYVEGRLQLDVWEDKNSGETRRKLRVVGDRMEFADPPPGGEGGASHEDRGSGGRVARQSPGQGRRLARASG